MLKKLSTRKRSGSYSIEDGDRQSVLANSNVEGDFSSNSSQTNYGLKMEEVVAMPHDVHSIADIDNFEYDDDDDDDRMSVKSYRSMKSRLSVKTTASARTTGSARTSASIKSPPKEKLKSALVNSIVKKEVVNLNDRYNRTRRYDAAGKYRIGPTFITKSRLAYVDENKPAKLHVIPDPQSKSLEFGLLTYLWTFTDQHDKQEIDLTFLQSLIDSGCNVNCRDEYGQTMLHAIVRDWHSDVALFAIRNNADINAQDRMGRTPLHLAAALNSVDMAKTLLHNGAKVDLVTVSEKQSAMHYAAKYNSLETMKVLIKFQGSFTQRDGKNRTVLFLAAEQGSTETAQFLLDVGAPAGIYDSEGNSAIANLLEKMPHVAYRALHQFVVTNMPLKRSEMYLSYLESGSTGKANMIAKSPLEMITIYDDIELIMHPVVQKAIQVKWKLFGRMDTIRKLFITILYLICWLVLAYTFTDNRDYYQPWSENGWKIAFEALIIIFALYFFYMDVAVKRDSVTYHRAWVEWRQHIVRANYSNCHPCWPGDREKLESESERIRSVPSLAGKQQFWFVYEWMILLVLAVIIITRVLDILLEDVDLFIAHKFVFGIGLMISFLRLLKIGIRFRYCSVFLRVTGLAVISFTQILFLYIQIYIPFVAVFWMMYGGQNGLDKIAKAHDFQPPSNDTIRQMTQLEHIFFHVYESSFGQEDLFFYSEVEKETAQTIISLFHVFTTFMTLSLFVALVTSKYTTHYNRCVAEASLLQAAVVLRLEKNLSGKDKQKLNNFYKKNCNPLIVPFEESTEHEHKRNALSQLRLTERRLNGIENIIREAEDKFQKNDRRSQNQILDSIRTSSESLNNKQTEFAKHVRTNMKEVTQKQEYMNRYLPKLLVQVIQQPR